MLLDTFPQKEKNKCAIFLSFFFPPPLHFRFLFFLGGRGKPRALTNTIARTRWMRRCTPCSWATTFLRPFAAATAQEHTALKRAFFFLPPFVYPSSSHPLDCSRNHQTRTILLYRAGVGKRRQSLGRRKAVRPLPPRVQPALPLNQNQSHELPLLRLRTVRLPGHAPTQGTTRAASYLAGRGDPTPRRGRALRGQPPTEAVQGGDESRVWG